MTDSVDIAFGDNVRVRDVEETRRLGLVGLVGQVYGVTAPSSTGVDVIGESIDDCAYNVAFNGQGNDFWFATHLLELVDHGAGTEVQLAGGSKYVRTSAGEWVESPSEPAAKPWWKFW